MEKMDLVINNLFLKKEYEKIVLFYEKNLMMNNDVFLSELKEISIYAIVFSLIVNEKTEEIEFLVYKLKKENLFSKDNFFSYLFLVLFSFLKNLNIFKALSLIGEIEVLNEDRFIELLGEEEFSYTNVLKCDDINVIPCLLLISSANIFVANFLS